MKSLGEASKLMKKAKQTDGQVDRQTDRQRFLKVDGISLMIRSFFPAGQEEKSAGPFKFSYHTFKFSVMLRLQESL